MKKLMIIIVLGVFLSFSTTTIAKSRNTNMKKVKKVKKSKTKKAKLKKLIESEGKININSATMKELISLPGIGKGTARKIIDYREVKGRFKTIRDIMKIKGIGKGKYKKIKDFIIADGKVVLVNPEDMGDTKIKKRKKKSKKLQKLKGKKININTASVKELTLLPGVGKGTAKKIAKYREQHKFRDIRNLLKVKGIGKSKFNKLREYITVD